MNQQTSPLTTEKRYANIDQSQSGPGSISRNRLQHDCDKGTHHVDKFKILSQAVPEETLLLALRAGLDLLQIRVMTDMRQSVQLDLTQTLLDLVHEGLTMQHLEKTQPELMAKVKEKFAAQRVQ